MKRLVHVFFVGILLATVGTGLFFSPYGQKIEEEFGLALLFKLRGPRLSPGKAVIVNIDHDSSKKLGLSDNFSKWPRTIHAALVDRLIQFGAEVIVFDIHFAESKDPEQDLMFAEAIRRAGNVVLVEELQHKFLVTTAQENLQGSIEVDIQVPPIKPLADAALALAPFPLPKVPVRLNQAWRFKTASGDIPTLPAAAFQAATFDHYDLLYSVLRQKVPTVAGTLPESAEQAIATIGLVETMRKLRALFLKNQWLVEDLTSKKGSILSAQDPVEAVEGLAALVSMYGGESSAFIDFYGPPASHTTLSYYDVLSSDNGTVAERIMGRVVFIGASRGSWSNQKDGFYTVFSQADGHDLSGVEIAATVFTNLYENRLVRHLSSAQSAGLIFFCAILACVVSFYLSPFLGGPLLLGGSLFSFTAAHYMFSANSIWTPLIFPLIVIPLCAFLAATLISYVTAHRERRNISTALGFYLPDNVVDELTKDLSFIKKGDKRVYSTCLMTDAQHYTTLSESMAPEELSTHMKEYYQYLFREVKNMDGLVCNVIGDSMLALWPAAQPEKHLRQKGCQAALHIAEAVERFNANYPKKTLPTRIGLHAGFMLMDNIGAEDHFEYAPVGDIVNTASRIEGLNKHLGTRILASREALEEVTDIPCRDLGLFLLGGKIKSVAIHELFSAGDRPRTHQHLYGEVFPEALALFKNGRWNKAQAAFKHCLKLNHQDGPSLFYLQLCQSYLIKEPENWQGGIRVDK